MQWSRWRENRIEEEDVVPADLSLEAKETVKSHLCLCAWQQAAGGHCVHIAMET